MKILTVAFLAATAVQGAEFNVRDFGAAEDAAPYHWDNGRLVR